MADIIKIDLTDVEDTLQGTYQQDFELTDYTDSATIELAAGNTETLGDDIYRVESGDLTITDSSVANGTVYVLVLDDGDGTASTYLSTNGGTFDPNKRGYFVDDVSVDDGAKVVFQMTKSTGPIYSNKARREDITGNDLKLSGDAVVIGTVTSDGIDTDGTVLKTKVVQIGDWNCWGSSTGSLTKDVVHGISDYTKIRNISVVMRNDTQTVFNQLAKYHNNQVDGGVDYFDSTNIRLRVNASFSYDNSGYDSTSYNRGWVTIIHEV